MVGSLAVLSKQIQSKINLLSKQEKTLYADLQNLKLVNNNLRATVSNRRGEYSQIDNQLKTKRVQLADAEQMLSRYRDDISVARLIINFLISPDRLSDSDFDQLFHLIVSLRQQRIVIRSQINKLKGTVSDEILIPRLSFYAKEHLSDIEQTKKKLASYLLPIVRDKLNSTL